MLLQSHQRVLLSPFLQLPQQPTGIFSFSFLFCTHSSMLLYNTSSISLSCRAIRGRSATPHRKPGRPPTRNIVPEAAVANEDEVHLSETEERAVTIVEPIPSSSTAATNRYLFEQKGFSLMSCNLVCFYAELDVTEV